MFPYFQINSFLIGPLAIQVWGLFVSLGILAGVGAAYWLARRYFLSAPALLDMAVWALLAGLLGGRIFYILFYAPDYFLRQPWDVLKFWQGGASSLGGFFGAVAAIWIFAKARHFNWKELLPYLDVGAVGLWLGWGFGRLGCFFIHDHPGRLTDFWGAVNFPQGPRHDLGLYESLLGFALFAVFLALFKKLARRGWGLIAGWSVFSYALVRFFLDFLRAVDLPASDARYSGLTPAQWGMILMILILTGLFIWGRIKPVQNNH